MGPLVMTSSTSSLRTGSWPFSLSDITRMVIFNRSVKLPEGAQFLCKYDEIFRVFYVKTLATQVQYPEIAIKYSSWLMNGYFPPIWKNHRYWLATIRRKMAKTFASCCVSIQSPNLHIKATFWICSSLRNSQHIQPSSTGYRNASTRSGLGASALEEGCSQLRSVLLFGGTPELSQLLRAMVKRWNGA